jgi:uridine kinase
MIEHLQRLKRGEAIDCPFYSFKSHTRVSETRHVASGKRIIIVEGILIFSDVELVDMFDIKIFVDTADDIRFIRRLRRDVSDRGRTITSVIDQYLRAVRPMHHQFVEVSKHHANIIIPYGYIPFPLT